MNDRVDIPASTRSKTGLQKPVAVTVYVYYSPADRIKENADPKPIASGAGKHLRERIRSDYARGNLSKKCGNLHFGDYIGQSPTRNNKGQHQQLPLQQCATARSAHAFVQKEPKT